MGSRNKPVSKLGIKPRVLTRMPLHLSLDKALSFLARSLRPNPRQQNPSSMGMEDQPLFSISLQGHYIGLAQQESGWANHTLLSCSVRDREDIRSLGEVQVHHAKESPEGSKKRTNPEAVQDGVEERLLHCFLTERLGCQCSGQRCRWPGPCTAAAT